jgi:hypothetical protein
MKILLFLVTFVFFFSSCSDESTSPEGLDNNLIKNSSFEFNGSPSFRDWNVSGEAEFYRDTPPDGGSYSVGIKESWIEFNSVSYSLAALPGSRVYTLTCWAKSGGIPASIAFEVHNDTLLYSRVTEVTDTVWRSYSIDETVNGTRGDTIKIFLKGSISQLLPSITYYDRCTLTEIIQ